MNPIAIDFETYYDKECSVKPLGTWAYCHHPEFYAYLLAVWDGEESWVGHPRDFNWEYLRGKKLLAHNAFFENTVIESLIEKGRIPDFGLKRGEVVCTANLSAFLCNRRALKDAAMFLLGIDVSKQARTGMEGVHWADVEHLPQGAQFREYAKHDPIHCWNIHAKFSNCWSPFEQELSAMTVVECMHGMRIDTAKLDRYLNDAKLLHFATEQKLPWLAAGDPKVKPTSTKAIAIACREAGIPCTPVKAREGEEAFEAWFTKYSPIYPWVAAVAQWRSVGKFIKALETLKARMRPDGSISYGLKYFGSHTGRWSGDAGFNVQNMKRDPLLIDTNGVLRQDDAAGIEFWNAVDNVEKAREGNL